MNNTELKQCPFCGQFMMIDEGEDVRESCSCNEAKKYQNQVADYAIQASRLAKLCGEGCADANDIPEDIRAVFKLVSEETYALLEDVLYSVVFCRIGKTRIELTDGTTITLSADVLERKMIVKNRLG